MDKWDDIDDAMLVRRYAEQGDREALGTLFRRHADAAYRTALRVMRNASEAEDAAQVAFMQVMRQAPNYRGGEGVRVWVMKIVVGTCKNMIKGAVRRRLREEKATESDTAPTGEKQAGGEMEGQVLNALEELPDKYRLPIWLHHYEGMSFHEIAGVLSISEVSLRGQVHRGLEMLRGSLGRGGGAVSGVALVTALSSLPAEAAPASLLEALGGVAQGASGMSAGGGAAATGGKVAMGAGMKAATVAGVILGGTALVTGVWYARDGAPDPGNRGIVTAPPAVRVPAREVLRSWDFDTPDSFPELKTTYGGWHHVSNGGPDGSGCMETDGDMTEVSIEVSIEQLPVMVTYRVAGIMPFPTNGFMSEVWWNRYESVAQFRGTTETPAMPMPRSGMLPWQSVKEYLTDNFADRWLDRYHLDVTVGKRKPDARLRLAIRGKHRIDDLRIRSIRPEDVPDVSTYLETLERIPSEKRTGTVLIPELKPGPTFRAVSVIFPPGQE